MKPIVQQIIISAVGVLIVVLLFQLPKFVVSDEEDVVEGTSSKRTGGSSGGSANEATFHENALSGADSLTLDSLKNKMDNATDEAQKLSAADEIVAHLIDHFQFTEITPYLEVLASGDVRWKRKAAQYAYKAFRSSGNEDMALKARNYYSDVLKGNPQDTTAMLRNAYVSALTDKQMPMKYIRTIKGVVSADPDNMMALQLYGDLFAFRNDFEGAAEQYRKVVRKSPDNIEAHGFLAEAYARMDEEDSLKMHLDIIEELNNDQDEFYNELVREYRKNLK